MLWIMPSLTWIIVPGENVVRIKIVGKKISPACVRYEKARFSFIPCVCKNVYLRELQRQRDSERKKLSYSSYLLLQLPENRTTLFPTWVARAQVPEPSSTIFLGVLTGIRSGAAGTQSGAHIWNASTIGWNLACCATTQVPLVILQ